jgi:hypothetical protein
MQRTAATSGIEEMRFNVGPMTNKPTALANSMRAYPAVHSQGVGAAAAASTHTGRNEAKEERSDNNRSQSHRRKLYKVRILGADLADQLNFEFARNKYSMTVFMIRLRRVYRA